MKFIIISLLFSIAINACKTKTIDPIFEDFDTTVSKSDQVVIYYEDRKDIKITSTSFSITNPSEIKSLRQLIKESKKSEDCFNLNGMISFYRNHKEIVSLDFGLSAECPSVYVYLNGKPITYKMSYRLGMFLNEAKEKASSK